MSIMVSGVTLGDLDRLVGEDGFRRQEDLLSFALSIGLFMDEGVEKESDVPIELASLPNCALVQVIVHQKKPAIETPEEMDEYLGPYMQKGLEMIAERTRPLAGDRALARLAYLLPA